MKKQKNMPAPAVAAPVEPEIVDEPTALTVKPARMPKIKGKTPGQRINFLHRLSVASGKLSIAAGIMAGWELTRAKEKCDHGQWLAWLNANTDITPRTAQNYMTVYSMTVGAARAALPEPIAQDVAPSPAELNEAATNVDAPTLNGLYKQLKILKANADHGGARPGAGRKSKGDAEVAAEKAASEASIRAELSAEEGRDLVQKLAGWALGADDGFGALSDGELARAVKTLKQVLARAEEIQSAREGAR